MERFKAVTHKAAGVRPAKRRDPVRAFRLSNEFLARVDDWAAKQKDHPGRSEAIRRLVERGLASGEAGGMLNPTAVKKALNAMEQSSVELAAIVRPKSAK